MAKGTYVLIFSLGDPRHIEVGKLGAFLFPAGYYAYVGSALGGLEHRIKRHLRRGKVLHWHVDYLREHAEVEQVWLASCVRRLECWWMQMVSDLPGAQLLFPGFGASDCRCPAHLAYFAQLPDLSPLGATRACTVEAWRCESRKD